MLFLLVLLMAAFYATPAASEPVSAAIGLTALLTSAGFGGAASLIGGIIVGGAISVGLSLAASLLQPHTGIGAVDSLGAGINSPEQRYTERQSAPSKRVILGSAYVGGPVFFEQSKAPYLTQGLLLNHGLISGVKKIWIGTNELSFAALVPGSILTPVAIDGQPDYPNRLRVSLRYGSVSQSIDPLIAGDYANIDATFCQKGIATAVFRFHYGADYNEFVNLWGQVQKPNAYLLVNGVAAYDPRDPTQLIDDESTWKFTNNATLLQAYYLTRPWGGRLSMARARWDKIAEAADYDDETVGCNDGTLIPRYTIDGVVTLNQKPSDLLPNLLSANRGYLLESGGYWWLSSSKPRTPIATIHDGILAGGITYQSAKAKRDLINKLQVRFVASEQDYQIVDGPILNRTDLQAIDQEVLTGKLDLPFTLDHRRAQRIQKAYLLNSRLGATIQCRVDVSFLANLSDELVGNAVNFSSDLFPQANGIYFCTLVGFADDFSTIDLALTEYDASIETDWNPATDEKPFVLADINVS